MLVENHKTKRKKSSVKSILERIIEKGGLYGKCAQMYYNDKEKSVRFVLECYEQCHTNLIKENWEEDLINDIIQCKLKHSQ